MRSRNYSYTLYLFAVVAGILFVLEFISLRINRSGGVEIPFFFGNSGSVEHFRSSDRFLALDPHLGYAHADDEPAVERLRSRYTWCKGFAIYSNRPLEELDRPLILTLGGSTTDPMHQGASWPEELAKLLVERGLAGTVVNGAAGGYSTNQELLKLIRDGIEFRPDLVISYSGVNDRGSYGSLPHPMVHRYQRTLLRTLTQSGTAPLVPNTISLIKSLADPDNKSSLRYTLGVKTERSMGEWYARNLSLMHAVTQASGAEFLGVVQPNAYVGNYEWPPDPDKGGKPAQYVASLRSLYAEIEDLPPQPDYVHSFIGIFDGVEGVYEEDGVHTTHKGDRMIAENMLELITGQGTWKR